MKIVFVISTQNVSVESFALNVDFSDHEFRVVSRDFVDRCGFAEQKYDPRSHTKQHEPESK